MKQTMKAVICPVYGPPEVLRIAEVEKPEPKEDEILVRVHASSVTVADVRVRGFNIPVSFRIPARFILGFRRPKRPVLGVELSGEVAAVGSNVKRFKTGNHIFAATPMTNFGAYAEYICIPENCQVAMKPERLSFAEAAVIPIGAVTALYYLRKADLRPGKSILIYGASGSVGTYAVQLAKHFGAHVTAVCSGTNAELVKSLGADRVIDYTVKDFAEQLDKYDAVLVAIDKISFSLCSRVMNDDGIYLNVTAPVPSLEMIRTKLTTGKRIVVGENVPETPALITELKALFDSETIRPVIDLTFPLEQIVEAHRYVDTGRKKGNVSIII